ncbi:hypothetical protein GTCCBUS3UF5_19360 [Geobacillus thermoleovorans CCB_US3_UF5]|uniref:Uncharacterized protein n=1 Tax=Geobacillus thermoleovorans CCB_US3_UF5 TaxID=1111068 RepID=A0ABM5MI09_GEOTH|nr:hypothetical protein GTCCBUS3UF5_19360 [Geobacillus thermoleovorans CCB_US3_UF5]
MSIRRLLGVAFLFLAISMFIEQMWWVGGICFLIGIGMTAKSPIDRKWRKKKHIW